MAERNIEESLKAAEKSLKRTHSKKEIKHKPSQESLSERLSRLAETRAHEELYKEEYRRKIASLNEDEDTTRVTKNGSATDVLEIENEISDTDTESAEIMAAQTAEACCELRVEEKEEAFDSFAESFDESELCEADEPICNSASDVATSREHIPGFEELGESTDGGEEYTASRGFEEYFFNTYGVEYSAEAIYDELFDPDEVDIPYNAAPDLSSINYTPEWERELDDYHDLPINFEDNDYREVYMPYKTEKLYPAGELYPEMSDIDLRDVVTELDEIDYSADDIEDNVMLVEARMLHEARMLKNRHKMLGYRFSLDESEVYQSRKKAVKEVNRRLSKLTKAKRCERAANIRYYLAADDKCIGNERKRIKNSAKIDSIRKRLDFLLAERSTLNKRLIELYAGADEARGRNNADRWLDKGVKRAKDVYKSQKRLARRVVKLKAPEILRSKIIGLMNEKIEAYARLEALLQRLRNGRLTRGAARAVKREIRLEKKKIRYLNSDLKYFIKRAERHNTVYYENGKQLAWIFGVLITLAVILGLYLAFGKG